VILQKHIRQFARPARIMSLRILATVAFSFACIATTAGMLCSYSSSTSNAGASQTSRLDMPWVKSPSAGGQAPGESTTAEELHALAGNVRATPEQRAQAIYLIAKAKDWDGVETLISQLDDAAPLVRGRAAVAIRYILGTDFYFRAQDDRTRRLASIDGIRRYWQARKANPPLSE
jgi:hypothetical protein